MFPNSKRAFNMSARQPENVATVEVHEHHVGPELGLVRTLDAVALEVAVHLLQRLQALGQVLVVDPRVEHHHVLFTQPLPAEYMKPS